jgi:hypothetical protein
MRHLLDRSNGGTDTNHVRQRDKKTSDKLIMARKMPLKLLVYIRNQ